MTSTGLLSDSVLAGARTAQGVLLAAALVGLGTGIHLPTLRRTGGRALLLGLASWVLVGTVSYAGVPGPSTEEARALDRADDHGRAVRSKRH